MRERAMVGGAASLFLAHSVSFWLLKALLLGHGWDLAFGLCVDCRLGLACVWGAAPRWLALQTEGRWGEQCCAGQSGCGVGETFERSWCRLH